MSLVLPSPYAASTTNVRRRNKTSTSTPAVAVVKEIRERTTTATSDVASMAAVGTGAAVTTINENTLDESGQQVNFNDGSAVIMMKRENSRLSSSSLNSSSTTTANTNNQSRTLTTTNSPPSSTPMMSGDQLSDDLSSTMSRMRDASLAGATHVHLAGGGMMPPSYNERVLIGEVEKLKKFVYYLKAENLTLNFKLNKYKHHVGEIDLEVETAKAKPESSDIDDFKV